MDMFFMITCIILTVLLVAVVGSLALLLIKDLWQDFRG